MRGLDGNYINTQGDASAKIQTAYQAELARQQMQAQLEATDALRKLREQVNETEKKDASGGPAEVKDDRESFSRNANQRDRSSGEEARREKPAKDAQRIESTDLSHHIDLRV